MKHLTTAFLFCICSLFFSKTTFAQKNSDILGTVTDSTDQPIVGASAILYFQKDSILTGFGLTDADGRFIISNVAPGSYYLQMNYVGYYGENKTVEKDDFSGKIDLGKIILKPNTDLEEIIVTNAPLEIRKDTIIYDADAFKTSENATVEDLLKKLPGIEVDDQGTITAQGEEVQNVLVDGKKFFGDDPKMATKNLPAKAIKNVEVYDKKSEKAEFTGVEDGEEEKTINLELKEEHKKGWFGNLTASGGLDQDSDGLYEGKAVLNRFTPSRQLGIIASTNNINSSAFSYRDYFTMAGQTVGRGSSLSLSGGPDFGRTPNGVNTSAVGGLNLNTTFGEKIDFQSNYFYNHNKNLYIKSLERDYFQDRGSLSYNEDSRGDGKTGNHRANVDVTFKPSKTDELKLVAGMTYADNKNFTDLTANTLNDDNELTNSNVKEDQVNGDNLGINSNFYWKHRFEKKGRSVFMNFGYQQTNTNQEQLTNAITTYYSPLQENPIDQSLVNDYNINTWLGDFSYTEPLKENHYLEVNYRISNDTEDKDQAYYNYLSSTPDPETDLSNRFNRDYLSNVGSVNYQIMGEKNKFTFGLGYQNAGLNLNTELATGIQTLDRTFTQVQPRFRWSYEMEEGRNFEVNLYTNLNPPSVNQLQPATNNTNPLNIYVGNPELEAQKTNGLNVFYHSFDRFSFTNIFLNGNFSLTRDNIINSQQFDENGVQTTKPVNAGNFFNSNIGLNFGKPVRAIRTRIDFNVNSSYSKGQLFLNRQLNDYDRWNNNFGLDFRNTNNEKLEVRLGTRFGYNTSAYSENQDNNQTFFNQFYSSNIRYEGLENWEFRTGLNYSIYDLGGNLGKRELPIWNARISRNFSENLGTIALDFGDLLNKNTGISQSQNLNYREDLVYNAIGRNGMLILNWKIMQGKKKKGEQSNEASEGPKPNVPKKESKEAPVKDAAPPMAPPPPPPPPM